jgi:hypothetical protein
VLDELERQQAQPAEEAWETADFRCQELAPDIYLLTYTLRQGERKTRRATIWQRTTDGWKIVFHQGTLMR